MQETQAASGPRLAARVVKGVAWVFAGRMAGRGLQLVKLVVLARLLVPEDFGLFGIALLAMAAIETFTQTGFEAALIQRRDDVQAYLDTAWTVQVIRGFLLSGALWMAAPLVGWFFAEPRAVPILRVMCLSAALGGLANIGVVYFHKDLEFHKKFLWDTTTAAVSTIVAVILAFRLRSAWAFVWAHILGVVVRCGLSYVIHSYRPRLRLDVSQARELFRFGRWVLASAVLFLFITHGDDVVAGKLLGVAALGLYQLAYRLSELPVTEISGVVSRVTFPALSKVQDDRRAVGALFGRALQATGMAVAPLSLGMVVLAADGTRVLLGDRWLPMVPALQVLAVSALIQSISAPAGSLFKALGRPGLGVILNVVRLAVMAVLIVPLTMYYGLLGTALSVLAGSAVKLPISFLLAGGMLGSSWRALGDRLRVPLVASCAAGIVVIAAHLLLGTGATGLFVIRCALFGGAYLACLGLMWPKGLRTGLSALKGGAPAAEGPQPWQLPTARMKR